MATKKFKLKGTISWARIRPEDRDMFDFNEETGAFDLPSATDGKYAVYLHLDDEEYKKLKRSGSLAAKHSKEDDVGREVVKLSRPHVKKDFNGNVLDWAGGPPKVFDEMGNSWNFDEKGVPGNDSEAIVEVAVWETKFSPGTRLESIKITNHVVYDPSAETEGDDDPADDVAF